MSSDFKYDPLEIGGSGQRVIETAGVNVTNRQLVRYNTSGQLVLADASAQATLPCIGITLASASAGQSVEILIKGFLGLSTWTWTLGDTLYVGDVAGSVVATAGTVRQQVGVAILATQIWFDPKGLDTVGSGGTGLLASTTRTVTAGNTDCGGWNHAQNTSDVTAVAIDEPNSFWWMSIDDANNITMHIASVDLQNDHQFRVLVF